MSRERTEAELVPVADRARWMLVYRLAVAGLLPGTTLLGLLNPARAMVVLLVGLAWVGLTMLSLPAARLGRGPAIAALTVSLFGDGVLICLLRPWFGWLGGSLELVVVGHVIAVTLLASFRSGAKLMLWHSLLALLLLEARAAGMLGTAVAVPTRLLTLYLAAFWFIMLSTASFAAVNERELRRRRFDSERLHALGMAVARSDGSVQTAELLAQFAVNELLARRSAVVFYPGEPSLDFAQPGVATVLTEGATPQTMPVPAGLPAASALRLAIRTGTPVLRSRVSPTADPAIDRLLPGARHLIIVPFAVAQASGVLILEHQRWSSQRTSRRVEMRLITTAEQATAYASVAIGRGLLLEQVKAMADIDGLTGLANRRTFDTELAAHLDRARRTAEPVSLIMIDLDHFKRLNDQFGHQVGDEVLQIAAEVLRQRSPDGALTARYGGEEMAIIVPGADKAAAAKLAEEIRAGLADAATPTPVTGSLGFATFPVAGRTAQDLITAADQALYRAKRAGRNRVEGARTHLKSASAA